MTPFKINCPEHGEYTLPDKAFGKPLKHGGVQEQEGALKLIGKRLFLANCPVCGTTREAVRLPTPR